MIYRFQSKADADLFMNQDPAERILAIIGKSPQAQGIIEPAAMAAAIARLEAAVASDAEERAARTSEGGAARAGGITLHQRAWPFIQLLKRNLEAGTPVVWGV